MGSQDSHVASVRRRVAARSLRLAAWSVAGVAGLSLVGNGLVHSDALELAIGAVQKDVTLRFEADWIWWPGHVKGSDFQLIVHDPKVQAELTVEEFDVDWRPWDLFSKTFHATRVDAKGVRFRVRKTRPLSALCRAAEGLPVIPGQTLPPGVARDGCEQQIDTAREPGPKPSRGDVFRVRLENVDATDVSEVWLERYRATGHGRVRGSWFFFPTFETSLSELHFDSHRWQIGRSGHPVVDRVRLHGTGALDTLHIRRPRGWFEGVTFTGTVAARGARLERLATMSGIEGDGEADLYLDLELDDGVLRYADTLIEGRNVAVNLEKTSVHGSPRASLRLKTSGTSTITRFRSGAIELEDVHLGDGEKPSTRFQADVAGDSWVSTHPLRASVGVTARTSNLEPLMALVAGLPKVMVDVLVKQSTDIRGDARLEVTSPRRVVVTDIEVEAGPLSAEGHVQLRPTLEGELEATLGPLTVTKSLGPPSDRR